MTELGGGWPTSLTAPTTRRITPISWGWPRPKTMT